jgi:hypothetical protein
MFMKINELVAGPVLARVAALMGGIPRGNAKVVDPVEEIAHKVAGACSPVVASGLTVMRDADGFHHLLTREFELGALQNSTLLTFRPIDPFPFVRMDFRLLAFPPYEP